MTRDLPPHLAALVAPPEPRPRAGEIAEQSEATRGLPQRAPQAVASGDATSNASRRGEPALPQRATRAPGGDAEQREATEGPPQRATRATGGDERKARGGGQPHTLPQRATRAPGGDAEQREAIEGASRPPLADVLEQREAIEGATLPPTDVLEQLVDLRRARVPCVLCTVTAASGSSPRKAGAKMLVLADGGVIGTIGGGAIEHHVVQQALEALRAGTPRTLDQHLTRDLGMCCGGRMQVFIEPQVYVPTLLVLGAGHVAASLAVLAAHAGFAVTVVDARPDWATDARFPLAREVRCEPPLDVVARLGPAEAAETYVAVVTHDHALDEDLVDLLLRTPVHYLGVIGSLRKRVRFRQRLAARGHSADALDRMRMPMGLDIGAVTPEEIAVSILAELVQVRRGRLDESASPMARLEQPRKRHEHPPTGEG